MKPYGYRIRRFDGDKCVDDRVEYEEMHPDIKANLERVFRLEITALFTASNEASVKEMQKELNVRKTLINELTTALHKSEQDKKIALARSNVLDEKSDCVSNTFVE